MGQRRFSPGTWSDVRRTAPFPNGSMKRRFGHCASLRFRAWRHEPQASAAPQPTRSLINCSAVEIQRNRRRGVLITAIMFEALGEHNPAVIRRPSLLNAFVGQAQSDLRGHLSPLQERSR